MFIRSDHFELEIIANPVRGWATLRCCLLYLVYVRIGNRGALWHSGPEGMLCVDGLYCSVR